MDDYSSTTHSIDPMSTESILRHAIEVDHIILQFFVGFPRNPGYASKHDMVDFYGDALEKWFPENEKIIQTTDFKASFKLDITNENYTGFPDVESLITHFIGGWKYAAITLADTSNRLGNAIIYERKENLPPHPDSPLIQSKRSTHPDSIDENEILSEQKREALLREWYEFQDELPEEPFQYRPSKVIYGNKHAYGMDVVLYCLKEYKYTDITYGPKKPHPQLAFDLDQGLNDEYRLTMLRHETPSLNVDGFRCECHPLLTIDESDGTVQLLQRRLTNVRELYPPKHIHDCDIDWIG